MPPFLHGMPIAMLSAKAVVVSPKNLMTDKVLGVLIRTFKSSLQAPIRIVSGFGAIEDGEFHLGVDIYMPRKTEVRCPSPGIIFDKRYDDELGNYVVISHGEGLYTIYGHLASYTDKDKGEHVAAGEVIGYSGITGLATDEALHFAVLKDDLCLNPEILLSMVK